MSTMALLTGLDPSSPNVVAYEALNKIQGVGGGFGLTVISFYASQAGMNQIACTIGGLLGLATVLCAGYRND